jgi:ABC-type multidrug transport system fused ATPase/permease subunit
MQRYYLASAKELMRINGTTKSALANHLGESVAGAITIRAFEEEDRFFEKNLELIDKNAGPYFYNFAATEWLIQRLETMSAAVLSFSAFVMALLPPGTFSPGEQLSPHTQIVKITARPTFHSLHLICNKLLDALFFPCMFQKYLHHN